MRLLKYIAATLLFLGYVWACDDEFKPDLPQGRVEEVAFAQDTFIFGESAGEVSVPIVAAKYVNYATTVQVGVRNGTAVEDSNFVIKEKMVKIPLGAEQAGLEMNIIDDTVINESRTFTLYIESVNGGGVPGAERQSCTVIIRNDDYIPQATIMFAKLRDTVREDGDSLVIPFYLTMEAEGDVTVAFAQGRYEDQTAREGEHFGFKNRVNKVTLPQGTLKGQVVLSIVNNDSPDGDVFFDLAVREVQGALIGKDSLCRITIQEDDLDRTLRFGHPEEGYYHEEAGIIEIPLILEGGVSEERPISGQIAVESYTDCTEEDFKLLTKEFSSAGNDTVKIRVALKDNEDFGDWGAKLILRGLKNVRALDKGVQVNVKDDERIFRFTQTALEIGEGEPLNIQVSLEGGKALTDIPWKVEVLEEGTTADAAQYSLPSSYLQMYKGTSTAEFTLKTFRHSSRNDRIVKLKLSATNGVGAASPGKILYDESMVCTVVIKNTDASVGFGVPDVATWFNQTVKVPVVTAGIEGDAVIYVQSKGTTAYGAVFSINGTTYQGHAIPVSVPGGGSIELEVVLNSVTRQEVPVELEISSVAGSGITDDDIDPETGMIVLDHVTLLNRLMSLNGTYQMTIFRQDQAMVTYENWGAQVVFENGNQVVATVDRYIHTNVDHGDGYVKFDYHGEDGTFHMRLGEEVGVDEGKAIAYFTRSTGNSGNYGTTVPLKMKPDFDRELLLWNTDGTVSGDGKMYPEDWTTADKGLRWGIYRYDPGTDPLKGALNTNIRCFKMTKK